MSKEKIKTNGNPVGVTSSRPHFEGIAKKYNGITLVALIITIIVILILVGVSVTVAINGGIFTTAKDAGNRTEDEIEKELALLEGPFEIDGKKYASFDDYVNNKEIIELPEGWTETTTPEEWTKADGTINDKVIAIIDENNNKVPVPEGYWVSLEEGESTISEGLVITDGENEFVWIPVKEDLEETYSSDNNYSEPTILVYDNKSKLNAYYGDNDYTILDTDEYQNNVSNEFAYKAHYAEMLSSVNKYNGFYIGRYETTIDENKIGSKKGAKVFSPNHPIEKTNNKACRWWGLYDKQRKSDVKGNGNIVQTNMVWGQQWDAMITFFGSKDYSETAVATLSTSGKQNAGQAKYKYTQTSGEEIIISDEICNIYDLRGNVHDWTAEANSTTGRVFCGGDYQNRYSASERASDGPGSEVLRTKRRFSPHTLYKITKIILCK